MKSGDLWMIYSGGQETQRGVALLLNKQSSQAVVEVDCISDRLMGVRLCGTPVDLVVMVVYMPTSNHTDVEVEELYDKIEGKLSTCRGKDYVVVLDMNATVGEEKILNVVGNNGLGTRNIKGEMLVDFCVRNKLSITNTLFKNNNRRRYTWKAQGDIRRLQWFTSSSDKGADASDHNLVIMKVGLKLKKVAKAKLILKWDREQLKTEKAEEYVNATNNELAKNTEKAITANNRWGRLRNAMMKRAENTIGNVKTKRIKKPWVNEEMLVKMDERRKWKNANTEVGRGKYRKLNNELRRTTDRAREQWWEEERGEIERLDGMGRSDRVYQRVKKLTSDKRSNNAQRGIKSKDGELLTDPHDINKRWKEYIEMLYNKDGRPTELFVEEESEVDKYEIGPDLM
ncbi:craniofacial development protein 2-like [Penaeus chinensis]|uniref:craniofacial development protein 2-like n=1 Tax=Penaeus chinensis TaxID=139456 RepID=UPI001FB628F4|nr:craniofacial development protein 2-like [Penaeus chinensis]